MDPITYTILALILVYLLSCIVRAGHVTEHE